ncbi:HYR domain-containing protein [Nocardioides iriomotensis]|uniref:HYR domain-containing protein n=1 Tax=Nocardioides iriomotensis TaxID=715784 RepID=A0A4Q5J892_9ACTN|nr:HYR domain-containing protein [Nocardioides iriomotensis]RYU14108.1 HYR domain-containing protein [Nocardioides iriomotensis]
MWAALALVVGPASAALADDISNNVDATVDAAQETMALLPNGANGTTVLRVITTSDDGKNGCNLTGSTTLVVSVSSSNPTVATVSPTSLTFDSCGATRIVTVTPKAPGSSTVSLAQTSNNSGGSFNLAPAAFTVNVAPPANTPPNVAVTGVSATSYEFGNVPTAACSVSDAEDGTKVVTPSLSPIAGDRAAAGLGSRTATCTYTDSGGATRSDSVTYTIRDTTAPVLTVAGPAPVEATGPTTPVTWSATASDAVDGDRPVTCVAGTRTVSSGDAFPVGSTTVTCSTVDVAGNHAADETFDVVVEDTTAPDIEVPANVVQGNDSYVVDYGDVTATDLVDGEIPATCLPASGATFTLGETTVTCTATDAAGNEGTDSFTVTIQDTTKPVVTVPEPITAEATGPDGAEVDFAVTAEDDVDGDLDVTCDPVSGSTFPLDVTTVECAATDAAGNVGTNTFTVTVEDTTAPEIDLPADITEEATSAAGAAVTWTASATDVVDGKVDVTCDPEAGSVFALTTTTVTCTARDAAGNEATDDFTVSVHDTTAPSLGDVDDIRAVEATGPDGAVVRYDAPDASDAVDPNPGVNCVPASGSTFALRETEVTCTATDAAGNSSHKTFTVEVVDTTAPKVAVPANIVVGNDLGADGASSVPFEVTALDIVDGDVAATCTPESGSAFGMGLHTVECSAADEAGNVGHGSFTVEVQDRNKPAVSVPQDLTEEATGPNGAQVEFSASAVDDVSGIVPTTCVPLSGSTFALGTTEVVCSASDAAGNVGDSKFEVTVQDTTAPVITVPAHVTATAASASGAAVTWAGASATDIVDGNVPVSCDRARGSTFALGTTEVQCSAADAAGNEARKSFTVTVAVPWSGILQPVNTDGSSVFKQGSTIPVKFRLTGTAANVNGLSAKLSYQRTGTSAGAVTEAVSTSNATTGNLFRWDPDGQLYIFNLGTKGLSVGTYQLIVDLGDGQQHSVKIALK